MQSYLNFSERYLEQLLAETIAIKGKESKVLKISTYNQKLQKMITGAGIGASGLASLDSSIAINIQQCTKCK